MTEFNDITCQILQGLEEILKQTTGVEDLINNSIDNVLQVYKIVMNKELTDYIAQK